LIFQSYEYLGLLLVVIGAYWFLPRIGQNVLLLCASYFFYAFVHPWLAVLLFGYTFVNYLAARGIRKYPHHGDKMVFVAAMSGLSVLGFFKYLGFFVENVADLISTIGLRSDPVVLQILLPVGISFYTFQSLGYVIDVNRGRMKPRSSFLDVALYVSFFPQLVAGPIERASRLLPQFERRRTFDPDEIRDGVFLILWGFFKKLVIADNVAVIANKVFTLQEPSVPLLAVGVIAFGIQILADFSGYTDIARGTAKVLGIRLSRNFDNPYLARSPIDFWRRWHISLSTWFRDYVYIPLGGSRGNMRKNVVVLMTTFLLTGLWHGAAWNFVLWGGYHGALILITRGLHDKIKSTGVLTSVLGILVTFIAINIGWLLFRADDLGIVWDSLSGQLNGTSVGDPRATAFLFFQVVIYSIPLWVHSMYQEIRGSVWAAHGLPAVVIQTPFRTAAATLLFLGILLTRNPGSQDFIYFQF
jgi:D-alanyl-lipoteichoic acid acyltransferase DltB (MBOAT superfamily)